MSPLLLDTHVFLWLVADPGRVPTPARTALEVPGVPLLLTLASVWELSLKTGLGKLRLPQPLPTFVRTRLERTDTTLLDITLAHVLAVADLPRHHGDPFDRLLVAQAREQGLTIVSGDPALRAYDVPVLWD